jgi:hypothetical protein
MEQVSLDQLRSYVASQQEWVCLPINILCEDNHIGEHVADIAQLIGPICPIEWKTRSLYLCNKYIDDTRTTRKQLTQYVRNSFANAGFHIVLHTINYIISHMAKIK